jgi:hypothetical protein
MVEVVAMDDDRFRPLTDDEREQTDSAPAAAIAKDDDWDLLDKADGDKEFWPRTWRKNRETGKEEWRWKNVPDPRPLYGLELPAQRPNAKVMVVEGEKCADVARRLFPGYVAVSPMNGARSPQLADWSPLRARDVTICGDNDKPGEAFVQIVGRILVGLGCKVSAVDITALVALASSARGAAVKTDGWDIADAADLWETPDALRAAVLNLVQPFVLTLDLAELERGDQGAFDLLIERCRDEPTCVTADVGIFNALKRLSQNALKARAWETLRSFLKGSRVDVAGLNRAIKAAIETEAYGKAGSGAKAGPARAAAGLAEGYWHDEHDGAVWTTEIVGRGLFRTQQDVRLCSSARVVRGESDGFGYNPGTRERWAQDLCPADPDVSSSHSRRLPEGWDETRLPADQGGLVSSQWQRRLRHSVWRDRRRR